MRRLKCASRVQFVQILIVRLAILQEPVLAVMLVPLYGMESALLVFKDVLCAVNLKKAATSNFVKMDSSICKTPELMLMNAYNVVLDV